MHILQPVILLLEDEDYDVFLFRRVLSRLGYQGAVRPVSGVEAAIRYLSNEGEFADVEYYPRPDLIVCDLRLFASTGSEMLAWIRMQRRFSDIPVVMLSGSSLPADRARAMELGARGFILKSADMDVAVERVRPFVEPLNR